MCMTPDAPQVTQTVTPPPAETPVPLASPYANDELSTGLSGLRVASRSSKARKGSSKGSTPSTGSGPAAVSTPGAVSPTAGSAASSSPSKGITPVSGRASRMSIPTP